MKLPRKRRLYLIMVLVLGVGVAVSLTLYALTKNINLYYTPSQVISQNFSAQQEFRIGGIVKKGSFHRDGDSLNVSFVLTDQHNDVAVNYHGVLPVLFRAGQGIVVQGHFDHRPIFVADQVLAKHDAKYMPPGIHKKG